MEWFIMTKDEFFMVTIGFILGYIVGSAHIYYILKTKDIKYQ